MTNVRVAIQKGAIASRKTNARTSTQFLAVSATPAFADFAFAKLASLTKDSFV